MNITAHINIVQHPNPECRSYHVTSLVSKARRFSFGRDSMNYSDEKENPGEVAKKLGKLLGKTPGVKSGSLSPYEVSIVKGEAFEWVDIGPAVLGHVVKALFPECIGDTIEVSVTRHVMDGDYSRSLDIAKRVKVPVKFGAKKRPMVYAEELFSGKPLRKVIDNTKKETLTTPKSLAVAG